jgi:hypothetical protein
MRRRPPSVVESKASLQRAFERTVLLDASIIDSFKTQLQEAEHTMQRVLTTIKNKAKALKRQATTKNKTTAKGKKYTNPTNEQAYVAIVQQSERDTQQKMYVNWAKKHAAMLAAKIATRKAVEKLNYWHSI